MSETAIILQRKPINLEYSRAKRRHFNRRNFLFE